MNGPSRILADTISQIARDPETPEILAARLRRALDTYRAECARETLKETLRRLDETR